MDDHRLRRPDACPECRRHLAFEAAAAGAADVRTRRHADRPDRCPVLDTVGTGRAGSAIPYQSLSGTSGGPMITGAAMVLAQDVDGSTPAERAAKLAALVKASVRPVDVLRQVLVGRTP
ncbi:MAG: hypothetical protein ACLT98_05165 [Eggerthellaceae bacterium]